MDHRKIETTQGLCVVALTKHLMDKISIPQDKAYARLLQMEVYSLLMDHETRLYLETNQYLCDACDMEMEHGERELYRFINDGYDY